jgi:3-isopropylmalate/(R)-2-methylmalate dehydratase small subunit
VRTRRASRSVSNSTSFRKQCLLGGLDEIGLTLRHRDEIAAFEARRLAARPWLKRELAA